jgi:hypothetical protein
MKMTPCFWLTVSLPLLTVASAAEGDLVTAAPTSWATVALAGISAIGGIITFLKARQVHQGLAETKALVLKIELSINSRMDELLSVTKNAAELKGAADEKIRQTAITAILDAESLKRLEDAPEGQTEAKVTLPRDLTVNLTVHTPKKTTAPQQSEPSATASPKPKKDS